MEANLNKLSPSALKAAMQGGTKYWGMWANFHQHIKYIEPVLANSRKRCTCGCKKRATYRGVCNGITLITGCELTIMRWKKQ